jgi:hypothetical protein
MYLEMKIKTVAIQFKVTQSVSTPKISKSIHDDHLFYLILLNLKWLVLEIGGIVHHHCSKLLFIINAHALIVIILIKV